MTTEHTDKWEFLNYFKILKYIDFLENFKF